MWCRYSRGYYRTDYWCLDCGSDGSEYDEDSFGSMSVPWGFGL